ncbi:MAG TPA: hypothetical protein VFP68_18280, partial [Burkholderiaceae bacterium]|nr:hypothetical protein [Burkholderiaceae bacterium]
MLPPDERVLIDMVDDSQRLSGAARSFSFALLENGIGGLSEWLSMLRDPHRNAHAKKLLEEFIELPSHFKDCVLGATRRLLERTSASGPGQDEEGGKTEGPLSGEEGGRRVTAGSASQSTDALRTGREAHSPSSAKLKMDRQRAVTMSFNEAALWHQNRLDDDALIDDVLVAILQALGINKTQTDVATRALRKFATALADADKGDSLRAFLERTKGLESEEEQDAIDELFAFLPNLGDSRRGLEGANGLKLALKLLRHMPDDERDARRAGASTRLPGVLDPVKVRRSLPPQELALLEKVEIVRNVPALVRFSSTLLLHGHGGLTEWLEMHKDGRLELARKLFVEMFVPGRRSLPALEALQQIAGIAPEARIRIQGTHSYIGDLNFKVQAGSEIASTSRDSRPGQPVTPSVAARTMTRSEAGQWFQNRKDDASLIDAVYVKRCGGERRRSANLLRHFCDALVARDRNATLRAFLCRFNSDEVEERRIAHDEVKAFDEQEAVGSRVEQALNVLSERRGTEDLNIAADEFEVFGSSGTKARKMLPPDDQNLLAMLDADARRRAQRSGRVDNQPAAVAIRFAVHLLEEGIGGLAEWLSMQGADASGDDRAQSKSLLDSFVLALPKGSHLKARITGTLSRLQALTGVDRRHKLMSVSGVANSTAHERPNKRQRGEGSSESAALDAGPRTIEQGGPQPWVFALSNVPRRRRTAREEVAREQRQGDLHAVQALPVDVVDAAPAAVKHEPSDADLNAPLAEVPVYVEAEMLDQARTAFYRELQLCDLSGDIAEWRLHLNRDDATVVRHRPEPMPENDHKFPLRDPADPLGRVHPRYAGLNGNCDPKVQIRDVRIGNGFRSYFRDFVKTDGRLRIDARELPGLIERLEEDARRELDRLIHERPGPVRCQPRVLQKADVMAHEKALVGQYGLFVRRPSPGSELPTLSNGRILGFYMGALLDNDDAVARTVSVHPDYALYAIDA